MKRQRRPPKTWRRNMLAGAALLALLDLSILSATPNTTREALALGVALVVGGFIVWVWVTNSKLERGAGKLG